jgi:hypothetical protein
MSGYVSHKVRKQLPNRATTPETIKIKRRIDSDRFFEACGVAPLPQHQCAKVRSLRQLNERDLSIMQAAPIEIWLSHDISDSKRLTADQNCPRPESAEETQDFIRG